MKSVLGKMLQHQFGRRGYTEYKEKLDNRQGMDIFLDIYGQLREQSEAELNHALGELLHTVQTSVRISRNFLYITLGYLVSVMMLTALQLHWLVFDGAMAVLTIAYGYKLLEFLFNRYCDVDVRIVLIYKIALFHRLEESGLQKEEHRV